jgi:N-formylglutamate amidohydrolase
MAIRSAAAHAALAALDASATRSADAADGDDSPFERRDPTQRVTPLVHLSAHSGRLYPETMMAASHLDAAAIRRSEDAWVDALVAGAPRSGGPLLLARYARAYVDLNREPYDLDPAMFEGVPPAAVAAPTPRAAAGLGSIARVVGDGQEIYRRKLTFAEAQARLEAVHAPWHHAVGQALEEARAQFGSGLLIDWHSMPSAAAGPGRRTPDIVLGDRFGASCAAPVVRWLEREFEARGYLVARNAPYAGGYACVRYGRPADGLHAIQVELNRALYLDERSLEPSSGFPALRRDLERLLSTMLKANWRALLSR